MERVQIGCNYVRQPYWKIVAGVPLIYLPILTTIPFVALGVFLVKTHLKYIGGMNIKGYWDFVPDWISHRYRLKDQPTANTPAVNLASYRFFWIFNCKLYCPLSVALFKYTTYLVQIVENWWCPFRHGKKAEYVDSAIDQSFWHVHPDEIVKLHVDDLENPIWNEGRKMQLKAGEERST